MVQTAVAPEERERTEPVEKLMREAYLDYAMSVIVSRALPDVRDGLKPVQRRVLYAMHDLGMRSTGPYRKSARVVGDVIAKYHPHGDAPVYEALVRLAQSFSLRYPLVDGQGNFGSVDNDPPAAMRYTEARLAAIAEEMLADIERETVAFVPNFDGAEHEPVVLPARLPNLLVNGSSGIAVGMATSIPPHNLTEICDALLFALDRWQEDGAWGSFEATTEELLQFIKGPDFPTGGIVRGLEGLQKAYATGRGKVIMEARAAIEHAQRGTRSQIVVTELPYQVNKAALVEKIAELVRLKRVDGIAEVRDESDREGLRVVVELRRDAQPEVVLNNLFEHTTMRSAFFINMLALVDGQPRVLPLKQLLQHYVQFRREVVTNRTRFDLRRAQDRAHVLEGLKVALDHLDEVIVLIRSSESADAARTALMDRYGLSQRQAQAVLDTQLRRLAALEREALLRELEELHNRIGELEALLADPVRITTTVRQEVVELREKHGDARLTEIFAEGIKQVRPEDLVPHQDVVVTLSTRGYIKRLPADTYRLQRRGGRGVTGMGTREEDAVQHLLVCDTHDVLLFFTNRGRVTTLRCFDLHADASRTARGIPLTNLVPLDPRERVTAVIDASDLSEGDDLVFATRLGEVKRTPLKPFTAVRSAGLIAMDLEEGDELVSARVTKEGDEIILATEQGQALCFAASELRKASRMSGGVRGIRLDPGDHLAGMEVLDNDLHLLIVSSRGFGKMTRGAIFPRHGRGTGGVRAFKVDANRTGRVVAIALVQREQEIILVSRNGIVIRTTLEQIPVQGRSTQGVTVMRLEEDDEVASVASVTGTRT